MKRALLAALALVALGACHREHAAAISYKAVGEDNSELRRAFNADVDKVRVVMLVAPS
jgi:hypothetical protein